MAGLTREGFTPLSYQEIVDRISARLVAFSPEMDLSTESPDGQLVEIFSFELAQAWSELNSVYHSYNPDVATGAGLRNVGLITGLTQGAATRSQAVVDLVGTSGTVIPKDTIVANDDGSEFTTALATILPASVQVIAKLSGETNVDANTITSIVSPISGWTSVNNPTDGQQGSLAQTETQFRNLRNKTVLRNFVSVKNTIRARLLETLRIEQVSVIENDNLTTTLPDGTPPQTLHVTVGKVGTTITDENIASVILATKGLGCPTYGSTTVTVNDDQGNPHDVSFSKATPIDIYINIEVLFLDEDYAGSVDLIKADLLTHINSLNSSEDVIWSRLFGFITPYSKAQVNVLELSTDDITYTPTNIVIDTDEYASLESANILITVVN